MSIIIAMVGFLVCMIMLGFELCSIAFDVLYGEDYEK